MGKEAKNFGYSLIELIMATAIISLLSAVAVPSYVRYIAYAREKACLMDRQAILYEYQLYCISEDEISLSDYICNNYAETTDCSCPGNGIYTAKGSGAAASLTCSTHPDSSAKAIAMPINTEIPINLLFSISLIKLP